jgi:dTDP-4-dehydrorhamnose reductase
METIIIFGANGMLGTYLSKYFEDVYTYNTEKRYKLIKITRKELDLAKITAEILKNYLDNIKISNCIVINVAGIIPQTGNNKYSEYIQVNSLFPNLLANYCLTRKWVMIHSSTDCVFSGLDGKYKEDSYTDGIGHYAISKILGEPKNCTIIRTSIIGEEKNNYRSLLEWLRQNSNKNENTVFGYTDHYWNGITCLQWCKIVDKIIRNNLYWNGIKHFYSNTISKYELLEYIKNVYNLSVNINPKNTGLKIDKTLLSNYENSIYNIPDIKTQLGELKNFILD